MALLTLAQLKKYENWIGKNAQNVYAGVLAAGGWKMVFPDSLPKWASRVRNFFNLTPQSLERLTGEAADKARKPVERFKFLLKCYDYEAFNRSKRDYKPNPWGTRNPDPLRPPEGCPTHVGRDVTQTPWYDEIAIRRALEGGVYKDQTGRQWFQMDAGSTIYHWGDQPVVAFAEAIYTSARGQEDIPVFKLISLDNTGGSVECIVTNPQQSKSIAKPNQTVVLAGGRVVTHLINQGSYNFSETIYMGRAAHELRDVKPHVASADFYLNPLDPLSNLGLRKFPANDRPDKAGKPLATQA